MENCREVTRENWHLIPTGSMIKYTDTDGEEKIGGEFVGYVVHENGDYIRLRSVVGKGTKVFTPKVSKIARIYKANNYYDLTLTALIGRLDELERLVHGLKRRDSRTFN